MTCSACIANGERHLQKSFFFYSKTRKKKELWKSKEILTLLTGSSLLFHSYCQQEKSKRNILRLQSITIYLTCSFFVLQLICVYLLSKHSAAEGKTCKQQRRGTMLTWAQQLIESRLGYSELFTRILDEHHKPDMFAAGCLPTFSPHFLETNGLFIGWQLTHCASLRCWYYRKRERLTTFPVSTRT